MTLLRPHLPEGRPLRILDAGCGTGGFLGDLSSLGPTAGVDASVAALALARTRAPFHLAAATVQALPFPSESLDLILSMDVLYHRSVPDEAQALGEMVRCLRPGGLLCVNLPAYGWLRSAHDDAIHTARRYTRRRVRRLLAAQPLRILRLTHWNAILFPGVAAVRLLRRTGRASDVRPVAPVLNALLASVLGAEAAWLARGDLPFGLSIAAVVRKEDPVR